MTSLRSVDKYSCSTQQDAVLHKLSSRALAHLPQLSEHVSEEIISQVRVYAGSSPVSRDDLTRAVDANLRTMIGALTGPDAMDLARARETGAARARQQVPLPEVLRAFRISFTSLWNRILDWGAESGEAELRALLSASARFWYLIDQHLEAVTEAYRDTTAEMVRAQRQRRAALLEALLAGGIVSETSLWDVTRVLGLPRDATFVVVAADTGQVANPSLPGIERALAQRGFTSAWRLTPSYELGVVALPTAARLAELVDALDSVATGRVGVSPPFEGLDHTPRALHLAHVARSSVAAGGASVVPLDESPLSVLVAAAPDEANHLTRRVLAPLLALPADERGLLLQTLDAYLTCGGSTKRAASRLFCHPNTVRYRLHRIETELKRSLNEPLELAELVVALRAHRVFGAGLGESRRR